MNRTSSPALLVLFGGREEWGYADVKLFESDGGLFGVTEETGDDGFIVCCFCCC
jgi:hypothetical protein